jgi:hypothetical protein
VNYIVCCYSTLTNFIFSAVCQSCVSLHSPQNIFFITGYFAFTDENADLIETDVSSAAVITDENIDQAKIDDKAAELEENGEVVDQPAEG